MLGLKLIHVSKRATGVRVTWPLPSILLLSLLLEWLKKRLLFEQHFHIWQMSPHFYSCDTCKITLDMKVFKNLKYDFA